MLAKLHRTHDVEGLKKILYGIQAGMADCGKLAEADPKFSEWFLRAQKSLEDTAKLIFREKYPNPLDTPTPGGADSETISKHIEAKRKRDHAFEKFLQEARF